MRRGDGFFEVAFYLRPLYLHTRSLSVAFSQFWFDGLYLAVTTRKSYRIVRARDYSLKIDIQTFYEYHCAMKQWHAINCHVNAPKLSLPEH